MKPWWSQGDLWKAASLPTKTKQSVDTLRVLDCGNDFIQWQVYVLWCLMYSCSCHTPFFSMRSSSFPVSTIQRLALVAIQLYQTGGHSSDSAIIPKSPSSHEVVVITTTWSAFLAKQKCHHFAQHYGLISSSSLTVHSTYLFNQNKRFKFHYRF